MAVVEMSTILRMQCFMLHPVASDENPLNRLTTFYLWHHGDNLFITLLSDKRRRSRMKYLSRFWPFTYGCSARRTRKRRLFRLIENARMYTQRHVGLKQLFHRIF